MRHRQLFQTYMFTENLNLGTDLPQAQIGFKKQRTRANIHTCIHTYIIQTRMHARAHTHTNKLTWSRTQGRTEGRICAISAWQQWVCKSLCLRRHTSHLQTPRQSSATRSSWLPPAEQSLQKTNWKSAKIRWRAGLLSENPCCHTRLHNIWQLTITAFHAPVLGRTVWVLRRVVLCRSNLLKLAMALFHLLRCLHLKQR